MAITVTYTHKSIERSEEPDELLGYVISVEDYNKLRNISNFLHSMEKCDADARRDLGHKIWLVLNNTEQNEVR